MMLSKPVASGAMLLLLVGAVGGAALQGDQAPEAAIVEVADAEMPADEVDDAEATETAQAQETDAEAQEPAERTASAADRVVESAGFPVVPQAERDRGQAETAGPVVTVNGQPLGGSSTSDGESETATASTDTEAREPDAPEANAAEETQVAVIPPPLPQPRPADLPVRQAEPAMDYDAIAEAAFGQQSGVLTPPPAQSSQPQALAPMPGVNQFGSGRNPDQDELVGVVGPNGEVLWVYEEQVRNMNSRVTVQRPQPFNPFGFVYE